MKSFVINGKSVVLNDDHSDKTLLEILRESKQRIDSPCGGNGKCGKCRVKVLNGTLFDKTGREYSAGETALACQVHVADGAELLSESGLSDGIVSQKAMDFDKSKTLSNGTALGAAFDLGTTTVGMCLVDLNSGETVFSCSEKNAQCAFGADVISRIAFDCENFGVLHNTISKQLDMMLKSSGADSKSIKKIVVAGNTVMQHILAGISVDSIGCYPYKPECLFLSDSDKFDVCLESARDAKIVFAPCVSGFFGGDITAGLLKVIDVSKKCTLYVDIGTNGEIGLIGGDKIWAASAAAGPALEGANIECGMNASDGAICRVFIDGSVETINGSKPVGICGSAVLDAVCMLKKRGDITSDGLIKGGLEKAFITENVYLTQADIRAVQLAKSAIRCSVELLLKSAGIACDDIERVVISGGFGCSLSMFSLFECEILPKELMHKTEFSKNCAMEGALMMLKDEKQIETARKIAKCCEYTELSENEDYAEEFVKYFEF